MHSIDLCANTQPQHGMRHTVPPAQSAARLALQTAGDALLVVAQTSERVLSAAAATAATAAAAVRELCAGWLPHRSCCCSLVREGWCRLCGDRGCGWQSLRPGPQPTVERLSGCEQRSDAGLQRVERHCAHIQVVCGQPGEKQLLHVNRSGQHGASSTLEAD